jgi:hypothetical protein
MVSMRNAIAATLAVTAGLAVANMLGVAAAEAPTTTPTTTTPERTVSVQGFGSVPITQDADLEAATSAYRQGMADAVSDGQSKAEFLAVKAGATLGSVQSIVEDGGSIECSAGGEESGYTPYQGAQPDFGSAAPASPDRVIAPIAAAAPAKSRKTAKRHPTAKKASAVTCTLSAQVLLVYAID